MGRPVSIVGGALAEFLGIRNSAVAAEEYAHFLVYRLDLHGADAVHAAVNAGVVSLSRRGSKPGYEPGNPLR